MRTLYIYLSHFKNGTAYADAYTEEQKSDLIERKLLFKVPEQWLPNTREEFLKACAYYNLKVPNDILWYGYVPF